MGIADFRNKKLIIYNGMHPITHLPFNNKVFYLNDFKARHPKVLRCIERSIFMKEVNKQNLCNFELSSQESMNVPMWIIVEFHQRDRQDSQNLINDTSVDYLLKLLNVLLEEKSNPMVRYC